MRLARRLFLLGLAGLILLVAAAPAGAAEPVPAACGSDCTSSAPATITRHSGATAPCVRDSACGGGGALAAGAGSLLVALAGLGTVAVALIVRRTRRGVTRPDGIGTLLARRLFHPPRVALGS